MIASSQKRTILIIEDDASMRNALRDKLTREGFFALEAKNGEEGLEAALRERPDLILLDIVMPKMDGMTMLKKLREENEWGRSARVIILTNLNEVGEIPIALEKGAYDYLVKSDWKLEDVVAKVRERLGE